MADDGVYSIILMPKANYWDWVVAAKDYVLKFGVNMTADPDSAGRFMMPQQVITVVDAPTGYPDQGDIRAWFSRNYPTPKLDVIPAKNPAELRAALAQRIATGNRYLAPAAAPTPTPTLDWRRTWPAGKCLVGLHGRADGRMQDADFAVVARARIEAVKLTSTASPDDVNRLLAINPEMFIMVRLFADFRNRVVLAEDFANWLAYDTGEFYQRGVRYFEIHNEVNLRAEGWGQSWQNGREFAKWWLTVRGALKALYPEAKFGWPGLSPDGFPMPERTNDMRFLDEAVDALRAADFLCAHCYWRDDAEMRSPNGGMGWKEYRRRYPEKLLFITEFSNPTEHTSHKVKGQQYAAYYQALRAEGGLGAAFAFVSSASSGFPHEAWRTEGGELTEIVSEMEHRAAA